MAIWYEAVRCCEKVRILQSQPTLMTMRRMRYHDRKTLHHKDPSQRKIYCRASTNIKSVQFTLGYCRRINKESPVRTRTLSAEYFNNKVWPTSLRLRGISSSTEAPPPRYVSEEEHQQLNALCSGMD